MKGLSESCLLKIINCGGQFKGYCQRQFMHIFSFFSRRQHKNSELYAKYSEQTADKIHSNPIWKLGSLGTHRLDSPWIWRVYNTTINCTTSVLRFFQIILNIELN